MIDQLVTQFDNEFHRLDRSVFQKTENSGSKAIQFTASTISEGVTSIVLAFSAFLARLHGPEDIIVVEANLRNPTFAKTFNINSEEGLTDLLGGGSDLDQVIHQAGEFEFSIIPAGNKNAAGCEAVESCLEHLGRVLVELRKRYRYILIDSPAILAHIDSTIISGFTDGVVVVVEANATRSEVLDEALGRLETSGAEILGSILNKREFNIPRWLYRIV